MAGERLLDILKPVLDLIPSIPKPQGALKFREKMHWTCIVLFIYLICCQIPLWGIFRYFVFFSLSLANNFIFS